MYSVVNRTNAFVDFEGGRSIFNETNQMLTNLPTSNLLIKKNVVY